MKLKIYFVYVRTPYIDIRNVFKNTNSSTGSLADVTIELSYCWVATMRE